MATELKIDYPAVVAEQSAAFTAAVSRPGALALPVPSCPGWTVADLVTHLGEVMTWWAHTLAEGGLMPEEEAVLTVATPGADLLGWWRARAEALTEALRNTPPESPAWCWWHPEQLGTAAEVAERMAHEALVHRWDAEHALGQATPVPAELGAAGIAEFATRMLPAREDTWTGSTGVVQLHATDLDLVWDFRAGEDGLRLLPEPAEAPAAVIAGAAGELDLLLWRRPAVVSTTGDQELAAAFLDWADLG
ncbi:maleylpyruvate isomerase family mycothiol-dependent enzyme [Crossiella sp. NPDC003009]